MTAAPMAVGRTAKIRMTLIRLAWGSKALCFGARAQWLGVSASQRLPRGRVLWAMAVVLVSGVSGCGASAPPAATSEPLKSPAPAESALQNASFSCVAVGSEVCFNALDDNCNGPIDEGCGVDGGLVQFIIAWQPPNADVDLEVRDPSGALIEVARAGGSGLLRDRDCPGDAEECAGRSMENVYLADEEKLMRGRYQVTVRLERWTDVETPVRVNFSARLGERRLGTQLVLQHQKQEYRAAWVL
jgi:hypothetical protein